MNSGTAAWLSLIPVTLVICGVAAALCAAAAAADEARYALTSSLPGNCAACLAWAPPRPASRWEALGGARGRLEGSGIPSACPSAIFPECPPPAQAAMQAVMAANKFKALEGKKKKDKKEKRVSKEIEEAAAVS